MSVVVLTACVSVLGGYSHCSRNEMTTVHWLLYSFRDIMLPALSQKRDIVFLLLILFAIFCLVQSVGCIIALSSYLKENTACPEIYLSLRVNIWWFAFNWNRNVLKIFDKKNRKINFTKICPVGFASFHRVIWTARYNEASQTQLKWHREPHYRHCCAAVSPTYKYAAVVLR
jgi:hypothetical protein